MKIGNIRVRVSIIAIAVFVIFVFLLLFTYAVTGDLFILLWGLPSRRSSSSYRRRSIT